MPIANRNCAGLTRFESRMPPARGAFFVGVIGFATPGLEKALLIVGAPYSSLRAEYGLRLPLSGRTRPNTRSHSFE